MPIYPFTISILLQKNSKLGGSSAPSTAPPQHPWTTTRMSAVSLWVCLLWTFPINGITEHVAFVPGCFCLGWSCQGSSMLWDAQKSLVSSSPKPPDSGNILKVWILLDFSQKKFTLCSFCMSAGGTHTGRQKDPDPRSWSDRKLWTGRCGCWKLNSGPLREP